MITELLLVDDHDGFRGFVRGLLGKENDMNVVGEASDGHSALQLAGELTPHVVLMDVVMPDVGGIETTRRILSAYPRIKIIGLSMHNERGFVDAMLAAGASGYILKDRASDELAKGIRAVMEGGIYLDEVLL